jgi:hypothetical protein
MHKTKTSNSASKLTVDINGLQDILSVGKNTASQIGDKAGAVIRIGRRKLYIVDKVNDYMKSLAESNIG